MIAGCVSAYIASALHGFQLELSGTCTQRPTEIKVGKQINIHGGKHSSKLIFFPNTHTLCQICIKTHMLRHHPKADSICEQPHIHSQDINAVMHHIHTHIRACLHSMTNTLQSHIQYTTVSIPDLDNCRRCNSKDNISPSFRISIFII